MLLDATQVERSRLKLVAHASPLVLEADLLDRIAALKATDPLAPVLVVVTSRRLADHVVGRLIERFGAVLGVLVLHHRALAERVVEHAGGTRPTVLDDELIEALVAQVVKRAPAGPLRDFVREHPGAAVAFRKTLTDLREAGIDAAVATATLSGAEAETAILYARFEAALLELKHHRSAGDDAALVHAATPLAAAFASRFTAIFHHGAYDLIGVRSELLRALDRGREVTFLLPAAAAERSGAFGVERASAIASPSRVSPLCRPAQKAEVSFFRAQGARAELQTAVYDALAAVAAGSPPHEVAIVVRAFGPYAIALDALFDNDSPRWNTSYTQPLRRDPVASFALRAICASSDRGPRRWSEHAVEFEMAAGRSTAGEALTRLLESLRAIETTLGDDRSVSLAEALAWLDGRVDASTVPSQGADGSGVRILDAMQARGLTFSHLNLAGMNSGIFPRVAREDPFLSDASRRLLREATSRPLPVAEESDREERLLLAMLLGSARESVRVSWQRSDENARPLVPSLALGAIVQFAGLDPDATDFETFGAALPAHPRERLSAWAREPGLLNHRDEILLVALGSESGADSGPAVAARRPELSSGVALVAATETFAPTAGRYDGRIGAPVRRETIAATALERLGRCPLQYFFHDMLRVRTTATPPTPFAEDPRTIGTRIHQVLQRVYARLLGERLFEGGEVIERTDRARELLREVWDDTADDETAARAERFPLLDRIERDAWRLTLDAFLEADLRRLAAAGLVPVAFEHDLTETIPGVAPELSVHARFDRVLAAGSATVVSDYKTGRHLASRVAPTAMLSGKALQVPLYALIANASVELLGVGRNREPEVVLFAGFKTPEHRNGVIETLRVVAALATTGRFPIRSGEGCRSCDYRSACRRGHPPTEFREGHAEDVRDARNCWAKSAKAPTLAAVRGESGS